MTQMQAQLKDSIHIYLNYWNYSRLKGSPIVWIKGIMYNCIIIFHWSGWKTLPWVIFAINWCFRKALKLKILV